MSNNDQPGAYESAVNTADGAGDPVVDYGLIKPIALPADGKMPDEAGISSQGEYDSYFRLIRQRPGLASWSHSCLEVQRKVLEDLGSTGLSAEDRADILAGCLLVVHKTLQRWIDQESDIDVEEVAA